MAQFIRLEGHRCSYALTLWPTFLCQYFSALGKLFTPQVLVFHRCIEPLKYYQLNVEVRYKNLELTTVTVNLKFQHRLLEAISFYKIRKSDSLHFFLLSSSHKWILIGQFLRKISVPSNSHFTDELFKRASYNQMLKIGKQHFI